MRLISMAAVVLFGVLEAAPVQSQDWSEYLAFEDFFSVNFPGEPTVRPATYETEHGLRLPARVYQVEDESGTYSVTVVDWREAPKMHEARFAACKAAAGDLRGGENPALCTNSTRGEIRGSALHAVWSFLKRGSEVTHLLQNNAEGVEGIRIQLLNKDGSRTYAVTYWHEYRFYVVEATAPKGMPPPSLFPVSFGFIDEEGKRVRYAGGYSPLYPVPPRAR